MRSARLIGAFATAALLMGCGGSPLPGAAGGASSRGAGVSARTWMLPDAKRATLLYVSDLGANAVDAFTYPQGKLVGALTGFGSVSGICTNKNGDLFVVDEAGPVVAYAHGGSTPLRKLTTSGAPYGCAADPVTGDLAVTNASSYLYGALAVYPKAKGKPRVYRDSQIDATWFCGYDDSGNLFLDAWNRYGKPIFVELPKRSRGLRVTIFGRDLVKPGGVQWDGKYVAVGDQGAGLIYRTNAAGHVQQVVRLKRGTDVEQFWIAGSTIVGPNAQSNGNVGLWQYPAGGSPRSTIGGFYYPIGAALSTAR